MNIQWYPGHMAKARRAMQENLKLIDVVIELLDARLPLSSRNPDIAQLAAGKSRLIVLTKADMADERVTRLWEEYFEAEGISVLKIDSRKKQEASRITPAIAQAAREKIERDKKRGIKNRPVRAMVAGIPNVGKSTFINSFVGRSSAKTGNKPGVTRGNQWIKAGKGIELLDTPGLLWPKFDDELVGIRLAISGSINDDILNIEELALWLVSYLMEQYPGTLSARYQVEETEPCSPAYLDRIALARNCISKGGEPDPGRAAKLLIDDYRSLRLGRISLEIPPEP